MPKANTTADRVRALIQPIAEELGLMLWDVRFVKEGASWFLRIFIDADGGVTIEDCERLSRAVDGPLDEADPIEQSYSLEVSSPGLGQELTRAEHFIWMQGEEIAVRLYAPVDGQKELTGILEGYENGELILGCGETKRIALKEISKARLNDDRDL